MVKDFLKWGRVNGLIWIAIGTGLCIGSIELKLGNFHHPGPGFTPFLTGALLGVLGLILMFSDLSNESEKGAQLLQAGGVFEKKNRKKLFFTLTTLLGYILLFEPLGFFLSTFFFFFFLYKLINPRRWLMALIFAGSSTIINYLIFSVWLKCQLPEGILAF